MQALPDGLCDISPEITLPGQGRFGFPLVGTDAAPQTRFRFTGTVTFRGHGDLLSVTIAEPWLSHSQGTWHLTCSDPASVSGRLEVGSGLLRTDRSHGTELRIALRLSDTATALFGGNYPPGEPMDDLVFRREGGETPDEPARHPQSEELMKERNTTQ